MGKKEKKRKKSERKKRGKIACDMKEHKKKYFKYRKNHHEFAWVAGYNVDMGPPDQVLN